MNAVTPNLITSVNLADEGTVDKPNYQFVYASVLYGTLFGIYAKFGIERMPGNSECRLKSCELALYNYRGATVIGFTYHLPQYVWNSVDKEHQVFFGIQATRVDSNKEFNIPGDVIVSKATPQLFSFNRILYPMPGFEFDINNLPDPKEVRVTPTDKSNFDSEFCYQNGVDYYYNQLRPGMYGFEKVVLSSKVEIKIPSARCHTGKANLFFG